MMNKAVKYQEGDKVEIVWQDSAIAHHGWEVVEDAQDQGLVICNTVGYVFENTSDYLVVVSTKNAVQVYGRITIPWTVITSDCLLEKK